jgi:hypothetical protein
LFFVGLKNHMNFGEVSLIINISAYDLRKILILRKI